MHIDENKRFDKRNIEKNVKDGIITEKDYETFLSKLPDVSDKLFSPDEATADSGKLEARKEGEMPLRKKAIKKKAKGKAK
ncbi:MAG: hypothetical protein ACXWMI_12670 [Syntrophales bacterium]